MSTATKEKETPVTSVDSGYTQPPAIVAQPTNRGRIGTDIPYPRKGWHYKWAADNRTHPQNVWRYKSEGWVIIDPRDAEEMGLSGYTDTETKETLVADVNNCIRYGDLILMGTTDEQFRRICDGKIRQFDDFEDPREKAKADIEAVQDEYKRGRR